MHRLFWFLLVVLAPVLARAGTFTPTQLHDEIVNNPSGLTCYAPNVASGNDVLVASCINAIGSGAPYVVSRGVVSRDRFLGGWADVIDNIRTITNPTIKAKWDYRRDNLIIPKETINYEDPVAANFFAEMVTDGLTGASGPLTTAEVTARTTRQGSRAEVLWGQGTLVPVKEVACALRGECL